MTLQSILNDAIRSHVLSQCGLREGVRVDVAEDGEIIFGTDPTDVMEVGDVLGRCRFSLSEQVTVAAFDHKIGLESWLKISYFDPRG